MGHDLNKTLVSIVRANDSQWKELLLGFHLEKPQNGTISLDSGFLNMAGWVVGKNSPVFKLELQCGEKIIEEASVNISRPDLAKLHPTLNYAGTSGFDLSLNVKDLTGVSNLELTAVLTNNTRCNLAKINLAKEKNHGYCFTCDSNVTFCARNEWLRDHYLCENCGSIPRERALMFCIEKFFPDWKKLQIHESSPGNRGASVKLQKNCPNYIGSHYFPNIPFGQVHLGWRNENLENQTFLDESFDLVISQDVMEHIFNPEKAFAEIARTLKPGGAHIFTVPLLNKEKPSSIATQIEQDGNIVYFCPPEYHGNPVDEKGALVTRHWGYDICDFILKHSGLYTTIVYIDDLSLGIRAEYIEVLVSRKSLK